MKSTSLLFLLLATAVGVSAQTPPAVLVLDDVAIVDVSSGRVRRNMTVLVGGKRIASVGERGAVLHPEGATVLDGQGKFLIPGLWDMHVHTVFGDWFPGGRDIALPSLSRTGSPACATWEGISTCSSTGGDKSRRALSSVPAWWFPGRCSTGRRRAFRARSRSRLL